MVPLKKILHGRSIKQTKQEEGAKYRPEVALKTPFSKESEGRDSIQIHRGQPGAVRRGGYQKIFILQVAVRKTVGMEKSQKLPPLAENVGHDLWIRIGMGQPAVQGLSVRNHLGDQVFANQKTESTPDAPGYGCGNRHTGMLEEASNFVGTAGGGGVTERQKPPLLSVFLENKTLGLNDDSRGVGFQSGSGVIQDSGPMLAKPRFKRRAEFGMDMPVEGLAERTAEAGLDHIGPE